jgi:hypothetical protein
MIPLPPSSSASPAPPHFSSTVEPAQPLSRSVSPVDGISGPGYVSEMAHFQLRQAHAHQSGPLHSLLSSGLNRSERSPKRTFDESENSEGSQSGSGESTSKRRRVRGRGSSVMLDNAPGVVGAGATPLGPAGEEGEMDVDVDGTGSEQSESVSASDDEDDVVSASGEGDGDGDGNASPPLKTPFLSPAGSSETSSDSSGSSVRSNSVVHDPMAMTTGTQTPLSLLSPLSSVPSTPSPEPEPISMVSHYTSPPPASVAKKPSSRASSNAAEKPLTRRERKKLGLPKPRRGESPLHVPVGQGQRRSAGKIVIPGGRYVKPGNAAAAAAPAVAVPAVSVGGGDDEEWRRNGSGRVDVRGFRELKIWGLRLVMDLHDDAWCMMMIWPWPC